jgi:hypothetical protein
MCKTEIHCILIYDTVLCPVHFVKNILNELWAETNLTELVI